jgi:hypothetical protein
LLHREDVALDLLHAGRTDYFDQASPVDEEVIDEVAKAAEDEAWVSRVNGRLTSYLLWRGYDR